MAEIVSLIDLNNNPKSWTPEQVIKEASEYLKEYNTCKKSLIILWDDTDEDIDNHVITFFQSGMSKPELVYLMEDLKFELLSGE